MSNILAVKMKPRIVFDATNRDHRRWAVEYIKNRSWRNCPVSFIVNDNSMETAYIIERQLIQFYANREFGEA